MEQFTKKAASALKLAAKAARRRGHSYIGSEHLLLGLLEEGEGTAAQVLIGAGVEEEKLKSLIDQLIAPEGGVGLASRGWLHSQSFRDPGKQCPGGRAFSYGAGGNRAHPAHDHQGSGVRGYAASSHDGRESPEALPGHSGQHGHPGGGLPGDEPREPEMQTGVRVEIRRLWSSTAGTSLPWQKRENWILWWEESRRLSGSWRS